MSAPDHSLRDELLERDKEYRQLYEEHHDSEQRLENLNQKDSLSEEDELEAKSIKRHKLFLKDRMQEILRSQRESLTTH
jgi:uncharacterized protein YdcH (DUF465 family)